MNHDHLPLPPLCHIPPDILCAADYAELARRFIPAPSYEYVAGGSGREDSVRGNEAAFARFAVMPRLLRDVTGGHTRLWLLGSQLAHPVLLAPVAFQKLAHPLGEVETARAAAALDACLVASTLSSCSLEEIAGAAGRERWFQLYFQPDRTHTLDLVRRAEVAGYRVLMVTLDASVQSPSLRSLRAGFRMPDGIGPANLASHATPHQVLLEADQSVIFQGMMSEAPTWADLEWLLGETSLPVVVKGVLHPGDAGRLQALGVAGQVVSNHGGRALDCAPASLAALPAVRQAVGIDYPLLLDGGIRSGSDIFKALASGADAVLVGRLQVYALSVAGALGVAHLLKLLREELEVCMALAGCATLADIGPEMIHCITDEATSC